MTVALSNQTYTFDEYLEMEELATDKHEYKNGEIVSMTGGTTDHNKIALNFAANLKFALKKQNYNIFIGDVKLWIPTYSEATYPDIMMITGEPTYYGTGKTTVMNPSLIVEVLSKSTQNYDQGEKFYYYRSIPEFQEYILISQYQKYVIQFNKNSQGQWVLSEYQNNNSVLSLQIVKFDISFVEIYDNIDFE
ncbi:MAG: Uma2 family endonuclease [Coleofasciculaceae cyanobacterium SM2_1_6]|nr:Uma2 family endonuclease [Coleofasciculaceae cyanobacterium SM2_1_6]